MSNDLTHSRTSNGTTNNINLKNGTVNSDVGINENSKN